MNLNEEKCLKSNICFAISIYRKYCYVYYCYVYCIAITTIAITTINITMVTISRLHYHLTQLALFFVLKV